MSLFRAEENSSFALKALINGLGGPGYWSLLWLDKLRYWFLVPGPTWQISCTYN